MPKADRRVDVYWEAVPYSDNYFDLSDPERAQVNDLFLAKVNTLVPPGQQQGWRDILAPLSDYDDILVQVNATLMQEVVPPPGTHLMLPTKNMIYWLPTDTGHRIVFFAKLSDISGANERAWELPPVSYQGADYLARMGLAYRCTLA